MKTYTQMAKAWGCTEVEIRSTITVIVYKRCRDSIFIPAQIEISECEIKAELIKSGKIKATKLSLA